MDEQLIICKPILKKPRERRDHLCSATPMMKGFQGEVESSLTFGC